MNYIILKYFYRKPEEILSFLMILDEIPNFPPKFVKNVHIKILIKKIKNKGQFFLNILLDLFYDCAKTAPPPPPNGLKSSK